MKKGKPSIGRIKCLKKTLKNLQKPGHEEYRGQRTSLYGRSRDLLESLWGEEAQHNERAEWIRREEKRKISYMDWTPKQITEMTSYLLKAHSWKSPGNDQIHNYWLKVLPATHRHTTKNFNAIIHEPEKAPDWLTTGITYLIPKSGDSKEVRNYRPITSLTTI